MHLAAAVRASRPPALLLAAGLLAGCGALQREVVSKVADAAPLEGRCAIDIAVESPSVHSPASVLLGSRVTRSIIRIRTPWSPGRLLPNQVQVSQVSDTGRETVLGWPQGAVTVGPGTIEIDLYAPLYDTVQAFHFNGTYALRNIASCQRLAGEAAA